MPEQPVPPPSRPAAGPDGDDPGPAAGVDGDGPGPAAGVDAAGPAARARWSPRPGGPAPAGRRDPAGPATVLPPLPDDDELVVSVVIPARDSAAALERAVASALAQDPAPAEVVVAVGPSGDGTEQLARRLAAGSGGRVRVVPNPAGTTPTALNAAIAAARGQVLARLDAHAELPTGYLAAAVAALRRTGAANVGGVQWPTAEAGFARAVAAAMRSPFGSGGASYRRPGEGDGAPVDTVYLGVFRREALDAVGGFDPTYVRNQDAELNARLTEAGYRVWLEPSLVVAYRPRGTPAALASQFFQYGRWRRRTARAHPGSLRARQLAAPALVVGLAGAAGASALLGRAWPLGLVAGGYLAVASAAGAAAAPSVRDWPGTTLALVTMHCAWGAGFLLGPPRERETLREGGPPRGDGAARVSDAREGGPPRGSPGVAP